MRQLKPGDVMSEMGFSRLNASVGMALARGTQLNPDLVKSLELNKMLVRQKRPFWVTFCQLKASLI